MSLAAGRIPAARLQTAFAQTEQLIRAHSRTFHFATRFLPPVQRRAVHSLYAFCRTADDLVDRRNATMAEIDHWRAEVVRPSSKQEDPVLLAWSLTRESFGISGRYEQELIDGVRMDIQPVSYATWADLEKYCYLVASTVGLLSLPIIGLSPGVTLEQAKPFAIRLGIALQLTNILRDVGEDAARGRIYLPLEDLSAFGLAAADIWRRTCDDRFRMLMQFEIRRAREYYLGALSGIPLLCKSARVSVGTAALLYRAILNEIEAIRYDVFARRAYTSLLRKIVMMPGILRTIASLRLPESEEAS